MLPSVVDMLNQIVATPSVSSIDPEFDRSNIEVIHLLANWLDDLGFDTSVKPLSTDKNKANLLARKGSGEGGLVFSGHSDTVPCRESDWSVDPYGLTMQDDKIYGLGTCDMKCFFPLALAACAAMDSKKLSKPICIAATSDEETGMAGARELEASDFPKADAVVIGEPTDLIPAFTHKGMAMMKVAIEGTAGHSSDPEAGNNAIDVLHQVIGELIEYRNVLRSKFANGAFAVEYPTLNLGCVHAGDVPNRICSHAEMQFDIRVLPGMANESVLAEVQGLLEKIERETDSVIHINTCSPTVPPFEIDVERELVQHLTRVSKRAPTGVAFGTEAPFFQALGLETVVFGPGSVAQAHQPDEFIRQDMLEPTQDILEGLIHKYCIRH